MPDEARPTAPTLSYRSVATRSGVMIVADADGRGGVTISVLHVHERHWPLAIGFGSLAAIATFAVVAIIFQDRGLSVRSAAMGVFGALCALLALAACVRDQSPPLELHADANGLRMSGAGEISEWTRDEIVHVLADDPRDRPPGVEPFVISIEFHDDELLVFAVPNAEDQAAVAAALRGALNLGVPTSERLR